MIKHVYCPISMALEHSRQIFEKYTSIKFHENPSRVVPCVDGRTDRHDEANSRFSQFSNALKNSISNRMLADQSRGQPVY
jgi:hypothetical protein